MAEGNEISVVGSHSDVATPFSNVYDRLYILNSDNVLYARKSDGTFYAFAPSKLSNTLFVDKLGNDLTGNGLSTNPFLTIQAAIDSAVNPGPANMYLIEIGLGIFVEDLVMRDFVFINGKFQNVAFVPGGAELTKLVGNITVPANTYCSIGHLYATGTNFTISGPNTVGKISNSRFSYTNILFDNGALIGTLDSVLESDNVPLVTNGSQLALTGFAIIKTDGSNQGISIDATSFFLHFAILFDRSLSTILGTEIKATNALDISYTTVPAYDDDAAAGVAGLLQGDPYQTTGAGAAPLNVPGIMMLKQ